MIGRDDLHVRQLSGPEPSHVAQVAWQDEQDCVVVTYDVVGQFSWQTPLPSTSMIDLNHGRPMNGRSVDLQEMHTSGVSGWQTRQS